MSIEIVVIGSINMDMVTRAARLPRPGETLIAKEFHTIPGGKGANQAVAAARLGSKVAMVGRVGIDSFGSILLDGLRNDNIDIQMIRRDSSFPTGNASIWVEDSGQNSILVVGGANMQVSIHDVKQAVNLFQQAKFVLLQFEIPLETVHYAVKTARANGAEVLVNAAPAHRSCLDWLNLIDILIVNESEAEALSGIPVNDPASGLKAAKSLQSKGASTIVLTLGQHGAWWVGNEEEFFPAFAVKAVDTTAAGDGFVGGLTSALAKGKPWQVAMRFASAVGALTVTRLGAQSSLPTLEETELFLQSNSSFNL